MCLFGYTFEQGKHNFSDLKMKKYIIKFVWLVDELGKLNFLVARIKFSGSGHAVTFHFPFIKMRFIFRVIPSVTLFHLLHYVIFGNFVPKSYFI